MSAHSLWANNSNALRCLVAEMAITGNATPSHFASHHRTVILFGICLPFSLLKFDDFNVYYSLRTHETFLWIHTRHLVLGSLLRHLFGRLQKDNGLIIFKANMHFELVRFMYTYVSMLLAAQ